MIDTPPTHINAHACRAKNNCARKTREAECTTCNDVSCWVCGFHLLLSKAADSVWGATWSLLFSKWTVDWWWSKMAQPRVWRCLHLVETKGPFTKEFINLWRHLIIFTVATYVQNIYVYENNTTSKYAILKAKVNPSQKSATDAHIWSMDNDSQRYWVC